jgi:hypothetical protein
MQNLNDDLNKDIKHYLQLARLNYRFAYTMVTATILSSIVAGVGGIAGITAYWASLTLGILALCPAAASVASSFLKPQGRANWHYRKAERLQALQRQLNYEGVGPEKISADWRTIDAEMNTEWNENFVLDVAGATVAVVSPKPPQSN